MVYQMDAEFWKSQELDFTVGALVELRPIFRRARNGDEIPLELLVVAVIVMHHQQLRRAERQLEAFQAFKGEPVHITFRFNLILNFNDFHLLRGWRFLVLLGIDHSEVTTQFAGGLFLGKDSWVALYVMRNDTLPAESLEGAE